MPAYQTDGSAGMDLVAALPGGLPLRLKRFQRALVPTGLVLELPRNTEAQVRPRSGMALKQGVTVLNAPGTIDSDYRGEVQVLLINFGAETATIQRGDRIAQLVVQTVLRGVLSDVATARATPRGAGGFGSTGTGAAATVGPTAKLRPPTVSKLKTTKKRTKSDKKRRLKKNNPL
jgi:dUTP pyrophosphatase